MAAPATINSALDGSGTGTKFTLNSGRSEMVAPLDEVKSQPSVDVVNSAHPKLDAPNDHVCTSAVTLMLSRPSPLGTKV
jgi:hypothetical protein